MTASRSYRFRKSQKLRKPAEFRVIYEGGTKAGDNTLLVFAFRNSNGVTWAGLSVSKKNGNAVRRNRIKRLLREAFRLVQHTLPTGLDLILIPRPGSAATFHDYRQCLPALVRRAAKRLPPADTSLPKHAAAKGSP